MTFRPAKPEDLQEFADRLPGSVRAMTAERDGVVYGVGGVYYERSIAGSHVIAFSHHRPDMPRKDRIRGARMIMEIIKEIHAPVYAVCGPFESAPRLLTHFGFRPIEGGPYYVFVP